MGRAQVESRLCCARRDSGTFTHCDVLAGFGLPCPYSFLEQAPELDTAFLSIVNGLRPYQTSYPDLHKLHDRKHRDSTLATRNYILGRQPSCAEPYMYLAAT